MIIQGAVSPLSEAESEPYFHSRAHGSQLGAWASRQSSVIGSRAVLDDRYARLEQRWPEGTIVPMPSFWGGYRLRHDVVEFWQGRANRLHDRLRYRRQGRTGQSSASRPDAEAPASISAPVVSAIRRNRIPSAAKGVCGDRARADRYHGDVSADHLRA